MRRWILAAPLVALLSLPATTLGQERWSVDLSAGGAVSTEDLADADLASGFVFDATVSYRLLPHLWVYGGWDRVGFSADDSFAGPSADFEETGYVYGLRFEHPFTSSSDVAFRVRAGGTFNHIEIENEEGDIVQDSDHGVGLEAGVGISFPVGDVWRLVPSGRFRMLSRDLDVDGTETEVDLRYFTFEIGISRVF